ncbi:MAG: PKD domain-containing protein [Bacteroidales bacterium]|nr:PKD domain-containing protein [Bacteroidales bacterium]
MKKVLITLLGIAILAIACEKETKKVKPSPQAEFTTKVTKKTVTLENISKHGEEYVIDFGDNTDELTTDKLTTHEHTYQEAGDYEVSVKAINKTGENTKKQNVKISESEIEAQVETAEGTNATFSKFTANYAIDKGNSGELVEFFMQLSKTEDFSEPEQIFIDKGISSSEQKLDDNSTQFEFKNLESEQQYFFRIKMIQGTQEKFSNISSGSTENIESLHNLSVKASELSNSAFKAAAKVNEYDDKCLDTYPTIAPLVFATDAEFTEIITTVNYGNEANIYYREPAQTIYVKSTLAYKGKQHTLVDQISTEAICLIEFTDNNKFDAEYSSLDGETIYIDSKDGQRFIVRFSQRNIQIGDYEIVLGDSQPSENQVRVYYVNAIENVVYKTSYVHEGVKLQVYKVDEEAVYARIIGALKFEHRPTDSKNTSSIIFKANK